MKHGHRFLICGLVVVALAVAVALIAPGGQGALAAPGIIYVDADATSGANDGSSWDDAYTDLQSALDVATAGDQIWVAAGTYAPTTEHGGTGNRYRSFQLLNGVALYGGFAGTEDNLDERDWVLHETILSGDLDGDDGPAFENNDENSYHVFYHPDGTDLDGSAILDGFTVTGGNAATYDLPHMHGGGMYNDGSSPTLANCTFEGNRVGMVGNGGAMANTNGSSPTLSDCTFSGNSAGSMGGGMANESSLPTLTNCTFSGNSADSGGGMFNDDGSSPVLTNCTFDGNSASGGNGGGMFNDNGSSPALTNCTFSENSAEYWGGGMANGYGSSPALINCILWGDTSPEIDNWGTSPVIAYSDIQGGCYTIPGNVCVTGNIAADPLFVDPGNGNFHLRQGSPCIDAGNNDAPDLPEVDFEGDDRILDGYGNGMAIVDMGVDEAQHEAPPSVIFVDLEAAGDNNGTSWEDAFTDLQPALTWAVNGVEIWVAEGIYKPTVEHGGPDRRYRSFQMKNGVALYGGFDPSVGDIALEDRDWVLHETILSGDLNGDDGPDFQNNDENSYHVFYHPADTALNNTAILDGFTITGGKADGTSFPESFPHSTGGGMHNEDSSPALANCTFSGNSADEWVGRGSGMANFRSSPTLTSCIFKGNSARSGGGMANSQSDPTLINCIFEGNSASGGGGMENWDSSPTLSNCMFASNSASSYGGGMENNDSSPTLTDCTFSRNSARDGGGIFNVNESSVTIANCIFEGNSASGSGGGIGNLISSPMLTNCTFQENSAGSDGGGMHNDEFSSPMLTNCTFSGNLADRGGGMFNNYSWPTLTNCILWANQAPEGGVIYNENSAAIITYSDVLGGYPGETNLDADPLFVDPDSGDYHLGPDSPCIDAGDNEAPALPPYDFEGDDRILDGDGDGTDTVDMGADEAFWYPVYLPLVLREY